MAADTSNTPGNTPGISARSTPAAAGSPVAVRVNGEPRETTAPTLADLVAEAGYGDAKIATALNGDFVAARARAHTRLKPGDQIEIVAPRQGG